MNYNERKRKKYYFYLLFALCCFGVWGILFWRVNSRYHYEEKEIYQPGDSFITNDCKIKINSVSLMSAEELAGICDNLTEEEIKSYISGIDNFWVVDIDITNIGEEEKDTQVYKWIVNCGGYGNGCTWLTDQNVPEIHNLPAGESKNVKVIFSMTEQGLEQMKKYEVRVYTSVYPEMNYIVGEKS